MCSKLYLRFGFTRIFPIILTNWFIYFTFLSLDILVLFTLSLFTTRTNQWILLNLNSMKIKRIMIRFISTTVTRLNHQSFIIETTKITARSKSTNTIINSTNHVKLFKVTVIFYNAAYILTQIQRFRTKITTIISFRKTETSQEEWSDNKMQRRERENLSRATANLP